MAGDGLGTGSMAKRATGPLSRATNLVAIVDGCETERHVEREFDAVAVFPGAVEIGPGAGGEAVSMALPLTVTLVLLPAHAGMRRAMVKRSGWVSARCMLVSPLAGY